MLDLLYPPQREAVDYLRDRKGVLIADEMGTGKTYTAIGLDTCHRLDNPTGWRPTLAVAPLAALDGWQVHFERLRPDLKVCTVNTKSATHRAKSFTDFQKAEADIYLLHWDVLRLMPQLKQVYWNHIIADECHRMKNRKAQMTQALKKIPANFRTAMSGTPIAGKPHELWSVLNWLYPEQYRSFWKFYEHHVEYEIIYPGGFHKVLGPKNEAELLAKIRPYYVRRLKKDMLKDLPEKYYDPPIWVDLGPTQKRAYNAMRDEQLAWVGANQDQPVAAPMVIAKLTRLQQFADAYCEVLEDGSVIMTDPSAKLDKFMQWAEDLPEGKQVVVFSQFKGMLALLEKRLANAGYSYVLFTGDNRTTRDEGKHLFMAGKAQFFLATPGAGGVAIDLYCASTVVFLDRSWSTIENQQAEDRLWRNGQKNAVQVIDFRARNTVDLGRHQKLVRDWAWVKRILGDAA